MTIFDNDISHFYCIGCNDEGDKEEGAMCESCGAHTCAEHIEMIDRTHIRPKHWKCPTCKKEADE